MNRKIIFLGIVVFLFVCTAKSLLALRQALKERDAAQKQ